MLETTLLRLIAGSDGGSAAEGRDRRVFMAGRAGPDGRWTWVAPDSRAARSFLPGPFSLALLIGGADREAGSPFPTPPPAAGSRS